MTAKRMSLEEAARFLSVSTRTVRAYIKQGFLSVQRERGDRHHWLDPLQVSEFKIDKDECGGRTIFTKRDFTQMRAELRRLRSQMDVVLRVLDAKDDPLRMPPSYASELFKLCVAHTKATNWEVTELRPWVEVFLRLDEEDLRTIADSAEVQKPWKPFLSLCISMTAFVATRKEYETSIELQALHRQLAEGRRRLRVAALIYSEAYSGMDPDIQRYALADSPASSVDSIARILKGAKK